MTRIVKKLTPVADDFRAEIQQAKRTTETHADLMKKCETMQQVELSGDATKERLESEVSVVAWNLERCLFPEESADLIAARNADIVLLTEVDNGMARTKQRHTTAEIAKRLGMQYAYGVEFLEMSLGMEVEKQFCNDDFNTLGFHGNAVLSKAPLARVAMFRLDTYGHWFAIDRGADPDQPRLGGRMAIAAVVPTKNGPICVVSVHLESCAQPPHRQREMESLMDHVEAFAPDMPVIIGGDLNTGNDVPPDFDWRQEGLFNAAINRGYSWDASPAGSTIRTSLITDNTGREMRLDWFATRSLTCKKCEIVPALYPQDKTLSDHEMIHCVVTRS